MRLKLNITNKLCEEVDFQLPNTTQEELDRKLEGVISTYFTRSTKHFPLLRASLLCQMYGWCPWQGIVRDYYPTYPESEDEELDDDEYYNLVESRAIMAKGTNLHKEDLKTRGDIKVSDEVRKLSVDKNLQTIEKQSIKPTDLDKPTKDVFEDTRDDNDVVFVSKLKEHPEMIKRIVDLPKAQELRKEKPRYDDLQIATNIRNRFRQHTELDQFRKGFSIDATEPAVFRELYIRSRYNGYNVFGHPDKVFVFMGMVIAVVEYKTVIKLLPKVIDKGKGYYEQALCCKYLACQLFNTKDCHTFIVVRSQKSDAPPLVDQFAGYPISAQGILDGAINLLRGKHTTITGECSRCSLNTRCPWAIDYDGGLTNKDLSPRECLEWFKEKSRWGIDSWRV